MGVLVQSQPRPRSASRESRKTRSGRPCWLLCYLRILAVEYTYIPGNPGWNLVSCNLSQAGTGAWHTVSAYSVSTHSKCVLAGIFSFFLPSTSPKPGYPSCCPSHCLISTPCGIWSSPTASPRGQPEPLAWLSLHCSSAS